MTRTRRRRGTCCAAPSYGTTRADSWSEGADGLFGARPDLNALTASYWSPTQLRYDAAEFARALPALLAVSPALRDLVRLPLRPDGRGPPGPLQPLPAVAARPPRRLRGQGREGVRASDGGVAARPRSAGARRGDRPGPPRWAAGSRTRGRGATTAQEKDRLEYDALSLLTVWGPRRSAEEGHLRDYANREWSGLVGGLYTLRWRTYFTTLSAALSTGGAPVPVDWYALEDTVGAHPPPVRGRAPGRHREGGGRGEPGTRPVRRRQLGPDARRQQTMALLRSGRGVLGLLGGAPLAGRAGFARLAGGRRLGHARAGNR